MKMDFNRGFLVGLGASIVGFLLAIILLRMVLLGPYCIQPWGK